MLSQELDEIESSSNIIEEMDAYLEGYCFEFDKSILPKKTPTSVKIQIAPESQTTNKFTENSFSQTGSDTTHTTPCPTPSPVSDTETAFDPDFDFYTYQFFQ